MKTLITLLVTGSSLPLAQPPQRKQPPQPMSFFFTSLWCRRRRQHLYMARTARRQCSDKGVCLYGKG
ncbi:MAG: hypothetical protein M3O20_13800 [Acidobacteriota bacterium]|nr:hypothetical protein [Acidobacteriota bacterium]